MKHLLIWMFLMSTRADLLVEWFENSHSCTLSTKTQTFKCSLGKNGVTPASSKIEGDGFTPSGSFPLRRGFFRSDRIINTPVTGLNMTATIPTSGWCDDPSSALYNQFITLPSTLSHENLYRDDNLYDILAVVGYNDEPPIPYKGSAIFLHVASPNYGPTAGCVSLSIDDLRRVLMEVEEGSLVEIVTRP